MVLLLLIAVIGVLYVPEARQKVLNKGIIVANEQTDFDIDLGHIYLSPFHHSPLLLYRAYKGKNDLPLAVEIDSLYVGHRGQDTLIYVHSLRLRANAKTENRSIADGQQLTAIPIEVEQLLLESTTFHSDSLISSVGVDVIVGHLATTSPGIVIAEGKYPLHGLRLHDADVGIDLRPSTDTTTDTNDNANDTVPMLMAYDVPDGELRNIHFRLTPLGLDIRTKSLLLGQDIPPSG